MTTPTEGTPNTNSAPNDDTNNEKPAAPAGAPTDEIVAAEKEPTFVSVEKTGDPAADLALTYLAKSGVPADSLAMQMAKQGDFSLLRAAVAKKGAEGEAYVDVLQAAHERKAADAKATRDKAESLVQGVVGGPENWAMVKSFIAEKASADELAEINAALRSGGVAARATAEYMKRVYEAGTGANLSKDAAGESPGRVPQGGRQSVSPTSGALSPQEYRAEVQKLAREVGEGRVQNDPRYSQLQARRRAYRG